MQNMLVGSTGFVGQNIAAAVDFDELYHSTNIEGAYGAQPDLLVYAGVRAAKFLANNDAEADWREVSKAVENVRRIAPKQLVLVSTIDVWKTPLGVDEETNVVTEGLHPYGLNRYRLEQAVREVLPDCLIVRLPALYGQGLKKNFLYDMMTLVPSMLTETKYQELVEKSSLVAESYLKQENGFWRCRYTPDDNIYETLKYEFEQSGFTSLAFTDSRAVYQFYDLANLWQHIGIALKNDIRLLHLAVEPVSAAEVYEYVYGRLFVNEFSRVVPHYDYRTKYAAILGGSNGYIANKTQVLRGIKNFVETQ